VICEGERRQGREEKAIMGWGRGRRPRSNLITQQRALSIRLLSMFASIAMEQGRDEALSVDLFVCSHQLTNRFRIRFLISVFSKGPSFV
jgi:hypothetical protein